MWWKQYCNTRLLSTIAIGNLNIPPTAALWETNWKAFGSTRKKKTNKLTNEYTTKLVSILQHFTFQSVICSQDKMR